MKQHRLNLDVPADPWKVILSGGRFEARRERRDAVPSPCPPHLYHPEETARSVARHLTAALLRGA